MQRVKRLALALSLLTAFAARPADAVVAVRGVSGMSDVTKIRLARAGRPIWRQPERPGQTLRTVLRDTCGSNSAAVEAQLSDLVLRLNGATSLDVTVPTGVSVALPFCLKVVERVRVTINEGDTLESILKEKYGVYGPRTAQRTFEMNRDLAGSPSLEHFSTHLQAGDEVLVPFSEERIFQEQRAPTATSTEEPTLEAIRAQHGEGSEESSERVLRSILASSPIPALSEAVASTITSVEVPKSIPEEYKYVQFVSTKTCGAAAANGPQVPFDVEQIAARFNIEMARVKGTDSPTVVGVIDSGIADFPASGIPDAFFAAKAEELEGATDEDKDGNGYFHDIYGINLNGGYANGMVLFYPTDKHKYHGTRVTALVLGGRSWIDKHAQKPPVQAKIVNYSSSGPGGGTAQPGLMGDAIAYLSAHGARVINMSLSNEQPTFGIVSALSDLQVLSKKPNPGRVLFVTAAGNRLEGGLDLGDLPVFPARYGGRTGDFRRTVLTVGAHLHDGSWAPFSHYSADFVDLLAPGCAVPTIDIDGKTALENGTSIATAVTSFAASLLFRLGLDDPQRVKLRLLAGVDVDDRLARRAWSSGRLNVAKTISVSHDVIEMNDGSGVVLAELADRGGLTRFCNDSAVAPLLKTILKVRPNLGTDEKPRIEYWHQVDGTLTKASCPQQGSDESIGEIQVDQTTRPGPTLKDVKDVVLASLEPSP